MLSFLSCDVLVIARSGNGWGRIQKHQRESVGIEIKKRLLLAENEPSLACPFARLQLISRCSRHTLRRATLGQGAGSGKRPARRAMDPADGVAATVDDDAEVLRAIWVAANGALDAHFFSHGERTSPLHWRGVSADPTSGRVHALDLKFCSELTSLPADVGRLTALRLLTLTRCAKLPPELSGCVALQVLDVRGCAALATLPSELSGCIALQTINLRGCAKLDTLPSELSGCVALQILDVRGCTALSGIAKGSLPRQCAVMRHGCTGIAATAGAPRLCAEQAAVLRALRAGSGGLLDDFWGEDDDDDDNPRYGLGLAAKYCPPRHPTRL